MKASQKGLMTVIGGLVFVLMFVFICMWAYPQYKIYRLEANGKASLAEAKWDKKVMVEDAQAEYEASEWKKKTAIRNARGVAEANDIIGDSLKGNDAYLRYLWIQNVGKDSDGERIYIATEAGLPILEARDNHIVTTKNPDDTTITEE